MMNRIILSVAFLAISPVTVIAQSGTLIMEKVTVRDPMVNNIVAGQMLIPKDWRFAGGMKWYPNSSHQVCFEATVSNPRGLEQYQALPWATYIWMTRPIIPLQTGSNYMGSLVLAPGEPKDIIEKVTIPQLRKGARVVRHYDLPDVAKFYAKALGSKVRSTRSRIEYTVNGQPVEEDIYLTLSYVSMEIGAGNTTTFWAPVASPFALRAARGQLDKVTPELLAVAHSGSVTSEWADAVAHVKSLFMKRMNQSIVDARTLSKQISANNDAILNIMREARQSRSAAEDRASKNFSDYIRGVQAYSGGGNSYVLPSGYSHAWAGSNGQVILSNAPNFNPNTGSTTNWTPLNPVR
jgi:hypothetical protein